MLGKVIANLLYESVAISDAAHVQVDTQMKDIMERVFEVGSPRDPDMRRRLVSRFRKHLLTEQVLTAWARNEHDVALSFPQDDNKDGYLMRLATIEHTFIRIDDAHYVVLDHDDYPNVHSVLQIPEYLVALEPFVEGVIVTTPVGVTSSNKISLNWCNFCNVFGIVHFDEMRAYVDKNKRRSDKVNYFKSSYNLHGGKYEGFFGDMVKGELRTDPKPEVTETSFYSPEKAFKLQMNFAKAHNHVRQGKQVDLSKFDKFLRPYPLKYFPSLVLHENVAHALYYLAIDLAREQRAFLF